MRSLNKLKAHFNRFVGNERGSWWFVGITVVTGAYKAYSQVQEGKAAENYYKAQAESNIAQGKAVLEGSERQQELEQDAGSRDVKKLKTQGQLVAASQRAALAANGIDLSSVTSQDLASDTFSKVKLDEIALRYNADVRAWQSEEDAKYTDWGLRMGADMSRMAGKNARAAAKREAVGTLLTTAASVYGGSGALTKSPATTTATTGSKVTNSGQGFSNYKGLNLLKK